MKIQEGHLKSIKSCRLFETLYQLHSLLFQMNLPEELKVWFHDLSSEFFVTGVKYHLMIFGLLSRFDDLRGTWRRMRREMLWPEHPNSCCLFESRVQYLRHHPIDQLSWVNHQVKYLIFRFFMNLDLILSTNYNFVHTVAEEQYKHICWSTSNTLFSFKLFFKYDTTWNKVE